MIKLVIAEDHKSLLEGIELSLRLEDNIDIIGTAMDGKELLEVLRHVTPDILLTDISMPRMNGVELCATMQRLHPSVKVIAFSMFEEQAAIRDMINAGVQGYVLKRRSMLEVVKAINKVYKGGKYFDSSIDLKEISNEDKADSKNLLSKSERDILRLIAQGKSSSEIADIRSTAVSTVEKHRKNMIIKLGLKGKGELLRYSLQKLDHYK